MSARGHTPGPWILGQNVSHEPTVRSADPGKDNGGFIICATFGARKHPNAYLIARAPDLADALAAVVQWHDAEEPRELAKAVYWARDLLQELGLSE